MMRAAAFVVVERIDGKVLLADVMVIRRVDR
jgi:hypothetical protein